MAAWLDLNFEIMIRVPHFLDVERTRFTIWTLQSNCCRRANKEHPRRLLVCGTPPKGGRFAGLLATKRN
jgi:hypothetical protein